MTTMDPDIAHPLEYDPATGQQRSEQEIEERKARLETERNDKRFDKINKGALSVNYFIRDKVGSGNFAVVRRIVRKTDGETLAAKIIPKRNLSESELASLHNEVHIIRELHHDNIVHFYEMLDTPRHLYLVLEMLTGGELFDRIVRRGHYSESQAAFIMRQVASACDYMHQQGIVHRDLKPENLIYATNDEDSLLKVTDFGLAKQSSGDRSLRTACGTPGYVAPEILAQKGYGTKVDMWSCGVILYILLCGFPPFHADNVRELYKKIQSGKYSFPSPYWDNVSDDAVNVVKRLLCVDPSGRFSAAELLRNEWVMGETASDGGNLLTDNFKKMVYTKKLRRGVQAIVSLNRIVEMAGLWDIAQTQRHQFRQNLRKQQRMEDLAEKLTQMGIEVGDEYRDVFQEERAGGSGSGNLGATEARGDAPISPLAH